MSLSSNGVSGLGKGGMLKRGQILCILEARPTGLAGGLMWDVKKNERTVHWPKKCFFPPRFLNLELSIINLL